MYLNCKKFLIFLILYRITHSNLLILLPAQNVPLCYTYGVAKSRHLKIAYLFSPSLG